MSLGPEMKVTQSGVCQKVGIIYPKMGFYSKLSMCQKVCRCSINRYMQLVFDLGNLKNALIPKQEILKYCQFFRTKQCNKFQDSQEFYILLW